VLHIDATRDGIWRGGRFQGIIIDHLRRIGILNHSRFGFPDEMQIIDFCMIGLLVFGSQDFDFPIAKNGSD